MSIASMSETAIAYLAPTPDENCAPSASPQKLRLSPPADPRQLGNMIQATKLLAGTGIGLRHAKDAIDQIMAGRNVVVLLPQAPGDIKNQLAAFGIVAAPLVI